MLGSLNLDAFVYYCKEPKFNYIDFEYSVRQAVNALNEVQREGIQYLPLEKQRENAEKWRYTLLYMLSCLAFYIRYSCHRFRHQMRIAIIWLHIDCQMLL